MIDNKICNCGGTYILKKGKWTCDSCGRPMPQILDSRENQLLAVAEGKFAQEKFIEAEELYGDIVKSFPHCYPAYWGLTLAKHGIKYVDDLRTGKKIATCWAPEISSIKEDKNYKKVLDIAPADERNYYQAQGEKIESIRKEWLEKAKKIKPYDVFICFKDTDDETKGRTEDSIELSDLYNSLTRDKYNVFFSRYSLEGITAENYEPYIFQALATAKVMIVYGSKEEYFESTWMKNEWTRFLHKIADGQKQKNALLPVVKGCSPNALPPRLRSLQVLDAGKNTFYSDLTRYIDKVLASSEDNVELQRNKIKFDKRQSVSRSQARKIQSRALQVEDVEIISAQGQQLMKVINSFVQQKQYERAEKFCDAWIKSNPSNYRDLEELVNTILKSNQIALAGKYVDYLVDNAPDRKKPQLWKLMIADGYTDINKWAEDCVRNKHINFEYMQRVLSLISQNDIAVLYAYYDGLANIDTFGEEVKNMILYALEFEADKNKKSEFLDAIVRKAVKDTTDNFAYFDFVISLLDDARYKKALTIFVENYGNADNLYSLQQVLPEGATYFLQALQKVLPLTDGELYFRAQCALIRILFETWQYKYAVDETQKMLGYAVDDNMYCKLLEDVLEYALKNIRPDNVAEVDEDVFRLLGFIKADEILDEEYYFGELAQICFDMRYKKGAERYAKLMIGCSSEGKYTGYYYLMLLALDCYNDDEVARLTVDIADTEGYNNWLANCDEDQISNATNYLNEIDEIKVRQRKDYERQVADKKAEKKEKSAKRNGKFITVLLGAIGLVSIAISVLCVILYCQSPLVLDNPSDSAHPTYVSTTITTFVAIFLTFPTVAAAVFCILVRLGKVEKIKDKFEKKGKAVICALLIFPLLIANVLVYTLDIGRYKFVDDIFYVKQEWDGSQSLCAIDLTDYQKGDVLFIPSSVSKIDDTVFPGAYATYIVIPKEVNTIDKYTFYGCKNLTIYCEAESKPEGWSDNWNIYKSEYGYKYACTTYWGYKKQDDTDSDGNVIFKASNCIDYKIVDGNAIVAKQVMNHKGSLTIPDSVTYDGVSYPVTAMEPSAFAGCSNLTGITITSNITDIPEKAFENCSNLEQVNNGTLKSIGAKAFYGCKMSYWSTYAEYIGDEAFGNCESLAKVVLNGSQVVIGKFAFANCSALTSASLSGTKSIGESAFENCALLTSVSVSDVMESIGAKAFAGCEKLNKVIIPSSIESMGANAFFGCSALNVYCRAQSLPDGWDMDWDNCDNSSKITVTWNYKGN